MSRVPEHWLIVERVDGRPIRVVGQSANAVGLKLGCCGHRCIARVVAGDRRTVGPDAVTSIRHKFLYLLLWPVLRDRETPAFRPLSDPGEHWNRDVARQAGAIVPVHEVGRSAAMVPLAENAITMASVRVVRLVRVMVHLLKTRTMADLRKPGLSCHDGDRDRRKSGRNHTTMMS